MRQITPDNENEGGRQGFSRKGPTKPKAQLLVLLFGPVEPPSSSSVNHPDPRDYACVRIYSNANDLNICLHNRIVENVAEVIQESTGEAISRLLVYEMLYSSEHLISYTLDLKGQETKSFIVGGWVSYILTEP